MRENIPESTAPTERVSVAQAGEYPDGAGAHAPEDYGTYAPGEEPFVPAPRWKAGRLTKVLVCACLVLAGGLGGAALQKAVDSSSVSGRTGQFQVGTQNGTGTGTGGQTGGFGGRNRASQAPSSAPTTAPSAAPAP